MRPIARRHINMPPQLRTGTAALVGRTAIVTERIVNDEAVGQVRLDGEVWSARAYDEDKVLEAGHARARDGDPGRHGARRRLRRQGWSV